MTYPVRSRQDAPRGEAGFTLIEVMIAIVILVFGLIGVTNLFLVAGSSNSVANQSSAATEVAAEILEGLKAQPWNSPQLAPGTYSTPANRPYDDIVGVGRITSTWTITAVDPDTKFISVRSQGTGVLSGSRSAAVFTTFRTCTTPTLGCP